MSDSITSIPGILGQQDFDAAVSRWVEVINKPDTAVLQNIFLDGTQLVTGVGFKIERIAQLVATIGATRVKAHFIINPVVKGGKPQFLLALFVVDALAARISSYYVPEHLYNSQLSFNQCSTNDEPITIHKNQIANVLAQRWLAGVFVAYCALDSLVFPEVARFKPALQLVESVLVLGLVALFFRKLLNELRVTNLGREPMFWASTGLVINHVGSLQILLFSNFLLSNYSKQLNLDIWAIHALLLVILYSCYCVALWIRPQN